MPSSEPAELQPPLPSPNATTAASARPAPAPLPNDAPGVRGELHGRLGQIHHRHPTTGFAIARFHLAEGGSCTVAGMFTDADAAATELTLWGSLVRGKKGLIFRVRDRWRGVRADLETPPRVGIERLCAELLPKIGPAAAQRLTAQFGDDTWHVLTRDPARLGQLVGADRAADYQRLLLAHGLPRVTAVAHLLGLGLSYAYAQRALTAFGTSAMAVLREDPYRLIGIPGVQFSTADRIARDPAGFAIAPTDPRRRAALAVAVLSEALEQGHTSQSRDDVLARIAALDEADDLEAAPVPDAGVQEAGTAATTPDALLAEALQAGHLAEDQGDIYLPRVLRDEREAVQHGAQLLLRPDAPLPLDLPTHPACAGMHPAQVHATALALTKGLVKIAGPAGSGKTYVLAALVRLARELGVPITLAAPTGKAADRMNEALVAAGIGPDPTRFGPGITAARTLQAIVGNDGAGRAAPDGILAIDEDSMIDLALWARLLRNVGPRTRVVLFGDPMQLASVMAGNVSRDLMRAASVPVVELEQIYRYKQASLLGIGAARVRRGEVPLFYGEKAERATTAALRAGGFDPATVERNCYRRQAATPLEGAVKVVDAARRLRDSRGFDPIADVQVYAPMTKGILGTLNLARMLQEAFNPDGEEIKSLFTLRFRAVAPLAQLGTRRKAPSGLPPRVGDTVVIAKDDARSGLVAGTRGVVTAVSPVGEVRVRLGADPTVPDRVVPALRVHETLLLEYEYHLRVGDPVLETRNEQKRDLANGMRGIIRARTPDGGIVVEYLGRQVTYTPRQLARLRPAWALTNHKGQGSECRASIIAMHEAEHHYMLDRSLFYVGLTRARDCAIYVGTDQALRIAMRQMKGEARHTRLPERLDARVAALRLHFPGTPGRDQATREATPAAPDASTPEGTPQDVPVPPPASVVTEPTPALSAARVSAMLSETVAPAEPVLELPLGLPPVPARVRRPHARRSSTRS